MYGKGGPHLRRELVLVVIAVIGLLGFDLSQHSIPLDEIHSGGPPKDGIPALFDPIFLPAREADFLSPEDRVLGLALGGIAKAYPVKILNWHEVVNDHLGSRPVLMTYCPLCGSGMAFDPTVNGAALTFGVSGLLYKSDVLMYDHRTESLWSQIKQQAVTGSMTGSRLRLLPLVHTTWRHWRQTHPHTMVLSLQTGFRRDYFRDPYSDYARSPRLMFPAGPVDERLSAKEWVIGIELDGNARAYPFVELSKGSGDLEDRIGSHTIYIRYDPDARSAVIEDEAGNLIPSVTAYWFAWFAFYPETEIYLDPGSS